MTIELTVNHRKSGQEDLDPRVGAPDAPVLEEVQTSFVRR
jgi:hypothetical protein